MLPRPMKQGQDPQRRARRDRDRHLARLRSKPSARFGAVGKINHRGGSLLGQHASP